jgi:hypothetical protein
MIIYVDSLDANLGSYFKLFLIMLELDTLYANLEGYFILFFIMAEISTLDANFLISYFDKL